MTPIDTTANRQAWPSGGDDDLAHLIAACGRDERPALQELYTHTAARLYGLALVATRSRDRADQVLVQTYLTIFDEAASYGHDSEQPMAWLLNMLARHLPEPARLAEARVAEAVQPSPSVWHKLDIELGLKRLDRHIRPGVATQKRGRDPMPNAYDRRIERQLRFWRAAGIVFGLAFFLTMGAIIWLGFYHGPRELLARWLPMPPSDSSPGPGALSQVLPPDGLPGATTVEAGAARADTVPAAAARGGGASRLAILQPAAGSRVWLVEEAAGAIAVTPLPPLALPLPSASAAAGGQVLALWAAAEPNSRLRHLGSLDPAGTTSIVLPPEFAGRALDLVISIEAAGRAPGDTPKGPLLFAGGRVP